MFLRLALSIILICFGLQAVAAISPVCNAFSPSIDDRVEAFFQSQLQPGRQLIGFTQVKEYVRNAIAYMGQQKQLGQAEKAEFWVGVSRLLNDKGDVSFYSDRFEGDAGAILFQGTGSGAWLVIRPDGDVYYGSRRPTLWPVRPPKPLWKEDYSMLKKVD